MLGAVIGRTRIQFSWYDARKKIGEYARADALFAERVRPMVLRERHALHARGKGAQIAVFRAHHYMSLSHPDETERAHARIPRVAGRPLKQSRMKRRTP
jgi:hypothetical protein